MRLNCDARIPISAKIGFSCLWSFDRSRGHRVFREIVNRLKDHDWKSKTNSARGTAISEPAEVTNPAIYRLFCSKDFHSETLKSTKLFVQQDLLSKKRHRFFSESKSFHSEKKSCFYFNRGIPAFSQSEMVNHLPVSKLSKLHFK